MKTVLITGGSRGIGKACAEKFAKEGYTVIFTYKKSEKEALKLINDTGAYGFCCDVSSKDEISELYDKIKKIGISSIDALVNNAGIAQQKLFFDITENDWDTMFDVNIKGMFLTSKCFAKDMVNRQKGSIVNVSSIWGLSGGSCEVHYAASKAAVIGLTRALADELGPTGVRVNCVAPGVINTDMNSHLSSEDIATLAEQTPLTKIGTPEEVAELVFYLSDKASFVTGEVVKISGGF